MSTQIYNAVRIKGATVEQCIEIGEKVLKLFCDNVIEDLYRLFKDGNPYNNELLAKYAKFYKEFKYKTIGRESDETSFNTVLYDAMAIETTNAERY